MPPMTKRHTGQAERVARAEVGFIEAVRAHDQAEEDATRYKTRSNQVIAEAALTNVRRMLEQYEDAEQRLHIVCHYDADLVLLSKAQGYLTVLRERMG